MSIHEADPATMPPRTWARLVRDTSTEELARATQGERRSILLDGVFAAMPAVFRPEIAGDLRAVVHWRIGGRPDSEADVFELIIADGRCTLSAAPRHPPTLTLTIGGVDFLRLVTGNTSAGRLVMRGRLKAKGDLILTAKFPRLFDNPRP